MTPLASAPVVLSAENAAAFCGVKPATLRVWRHRYGLTAHRIGGANHYDLDELAAVLARRAGDSSSGA